MNLGERHVFVRYIIKALVSDTQVGPVHQHMIEDTSAGDFSPALDYPAL